MIDLRMGSGEFVLSQFLWLGISHEREIKTMFASEKSEMTAQSFL